MIENIDRAAEVIGAWIDDNLPYDEANFGADEGIAQALADAGLLAPNLPEPRMILSDGSPMWVGNLETSIGVDDGLVYIDGGLLAPGEAREEAAMILAAADYAEGVGRA